MLLRASSTAGLRPFLQVMNLFTFTLAAACAAIGAMRIKLVPHFELCDHFVGDFWRGPGGTVICSLSW